MRLEPKLAIAVVVVSLVGLLAVFFGSHEMPPRWSSSRMSFCGGSPTYFQERELYNFEKTDFSDSATAFQILNGKMQELRLVVDSVGDANERRILLSLTNMGDREFITRNTKITFLLGETTVGFDDPEEAKISKGQTADWFSRAGKISDGEYDISVSIIDQSTCALKAFGQIAIKNSLSAGEIINVNVGGSTLDIPPGLVAVGFKDWTKIDPFIRAGIKVLSFNREKIAVWSDISPDPKILIEPGVGYYLQNTSSEMVRVDLEEPYKVPVNVSTHTIRPGWNVLHNDSGRDISDFEFMVSIGGPEYKMRNLNLEKRSLGDLVKQGLIDKQGFSVSKFQELGNLDIEPFNIGERAFADEEVFWVYLHDEPAEQEMKMQNLNLEIKTDKDTYGAGEQVRISFKVTNDSDLNYDVSSQDRDDNCQNGFAVLKGRDVIYSTVPTSLGLCPSWPNQINLHSASQIEYNRVWRVPSDISGQLRIVGYFDQSRAFSKDKKVKQVFINVSNNE